MNRWLLGSGAIVSSAMAIYGWTHPSALNMSALADNGDNSKPLPQEMEVSYDRLLKQARTVASSNQLGDAITTVAGIPKNSRFYGEALQLQEGWVQELFQRAGSQYKQANLQMAMWMLDAVPTNSQQYARATEARNRWNQEADVLRRATVAKDKGDWKGVITALKSLQGSMLYQSAPVQAHLQLATAKLYEPAKIEKLASADAVAVIANIPSVPSLIESDVTLPSIEVATVASLPINRSQALRWAEPIAANPNDRLMSDRAIAPNSSGLADSPAPEFVPLEWSPSQYAATPDPNSTAQNSPKPDTTPNRPAASATLSAPSRPVTPNRDLTELPRSGRRQLMGRMSAARNQQSVAVQTAPSTSSQMSWNEQVSWDGQMAEMPTANSTSQSSNLCQSPTCDFEGFRVLVAH